VTGALDRRALGTLAAGHACADMAQGAVPALLPFLIDQRGFSYGAAGALLLATSVGSSAIQPLFGLGSDRLSLPWLMPLGVLMAGVGVALVGITGSYAVTVLAVVLSGLGVAAFHPEGARFANQVSGVRRGAGMSLFSLGGNAGFALGPILVTPLVLLFGLHGTLLLAVLPALVAAVIVRELPRLREVAATKSALVARAVGEDERDADDWNAFLRLGGVVTLRSGVYFGLQAFVPLWFIHHLDTSEGAGNAALTAMLVAGAAGTFCGGRVVDRLGRRRLLVGSCAASIPLLAALVLAPSPLIAGVLTALVGFVIILTFSVSVVMSQEYLPSRLGLASGVSLGLAIGMGGIAAALMGVIADAAGLRTVMWIIVGLAVPMLALARTLPVTRAERRAQSIVAAQRAADATPGAAGPAPAPGSASPHPSG
jgi:FSR family fosmidomycin resistance protein-like MFS transporter